VGKSSPKNAAQGLLNRPVVPGGWVRPAVSKEINMIRTIAAALAAFCLVSFGAFAQGSTGTSTDTGTSAKTETKSDTTGTKMSKKHKKHAKKAKKEAAAKSDTSSSSSAAPK
jgi:adenosylcobinamide amidohydrolase